MKHRRPCSVWLMGLIGPFLVVMASTGTGCGVDDSLICGAACDPLRRGMSDGPGGLSEARASADDAASDATGNADDSGQADSSTAVSDGAAQDESTDDGAMA